MIQGMYHLPVSTLCAVSVSFTACLLLPIQTYIGSVLVSVNPYKTIRDLYGSGTMDQYRGVNFYELPPHVYVTVWHRLYNM